EKPAEPEAPLPEAKAPEPLPEAPKALPEAPEPLPQAPEVLPEAPEVLPEAREVLPEAPEALPEARKTPLPAEPSHEAAAIPPEPPANPPGETYLDDPGWLDGEELEDTVPGSPRIDPPSRRTNPPSNHAQVGESGDIYSAKDLKNMKEDDIIRLVHEGMIPIHLINTSNCRKLAMKMNRRMEAHDAVNFPNCLKLFEGSNDDRKKLLRQFLLDHRNLEKMEHQFDLARTNEKEQKGVEELLTIEGMRKAGVSEQKIKRIVATKKPVLDEEYPDLMEEARWWVNVSTTRSQSDRITTTLSASAAVKGGADVANLLSSDLQGPKQTLAPVNADQLTQMLALTNAP
ncbi:Angiopoietin-related protein 1, partial [Durusdinium trenchii]